MDNYQHKRRKQLTEIEEAAERVYERLETKWTKLEPKKTSRFNSLLSFIVFLLISTSLLFLTGILYNLLNKNKSYTKELFIEELNNNANIDIKHVPKDLILVHKHANLQESISVLANKYWIDNTSFEFWNNFYKSLPKK